jgi:hypothetical protein
MKIGYLVPILIGVPGGIFFDFGGAKKFAAV